MSTAADCVFCKIISGQLPAAKVLETDTAIAFLDIQPLAPGHVLVVPKEHHATLADVPADAFSRFAGVLPRVSRAVLEATRAPALMVRCHSGKEAGQEVPHLHFHLIPRHAGDGLDAAEQRTAADPADLDVVRAKISAAINA